MRVTCRTDSYDGSHDIDRKPELINNKSYDVLEHYGVLDHSQWGGHLLRNEKGHKHWYRYLSGLYCGDKNFEIINE